MPELRLIFTWHAIALAVLCVMWFLANWGQWSW